MVVFSVPKDLDQVEKSLEWFWTVLKLTLDCMSCLCLDMLFLYLNNMLCCWVMLWVVSKWASGLFISPCELICVIAMNE